MSILALDIGTKKIGLAISQSELLAEEFCTIRSDQDDQMIMEIIFLIKRKKITKLIVGLPKSPKTISVQEQKIKKLVEKLQDQLKKMDLKVEIFFEDETLTSKEAERILFSQDKSLQEVLERRDQLAAKLILDQYLNR